MTDRIPRIADVGDVGTKTAESTGAGRESSDATLRRRISLRSYIGGPAPQPRDRFVPQRETPNTRGSRGTTRRSLEWIA